MQTKTQDGGGEFSELLVGAEDASPEQSKRTRGSPDVTRIFHRIHQHNANNDDDSVSSASDCIFHPSPTNEMLPSGLKRDRLESINESPSQAARQQRTETRAFVHKSIVRPQVCTEHKFCLANVPDSPKEVMPGRDQSLVMHRVGPNYSNNNISSCINQTSLQQIQQKQLNQTHAESSQEFQLSQQPLEQNNNLLHVSFNLNNQDVLDEFVGLAHRNNHNQSAQIDPDLSGIQSNNTVEEGHPINAGSHNIMLAASNNNLSKRSEVDKSLQIISPCKKQKVSDPKVLNPWEKVVVTQQGIDDWRAQMYGVDVKNFPKLKPEGMPQDLYNELKKTYKVKTRVRHSQKNKAEEEDDDEEDKKNRVEARYMDWHKKIQAQKHAMSNSPQRNAEFSSSGRQRKDFAQIKEDQESETVSNFSRMMDKQNPQRQSRESFDQRRQVPPAASYKTNIFHRDTKVDRLIEDLAPTEEQKVKKAQFEAIKKAQDEAVIERRRIERNKKTKIALTQKQKVHAEQLFQQLKGTVSRKEIEQIAFNAKDRNRIQRRMAQSAVNTGAQNQRQRAETAQNQPTLIKSQVNHQYGNQRQPQQQMMSSQKRAQSALHNNHPMNIQENADPNLRHSSQSGLNVNNNKSSVAYALATPQHMNKNHSSVSIRQGRQLNSGQQSRSSLLRQQRHQIGSNQNGPQQQNYLSAHVSETRFHSAQKHPSVFSYGQSHQQQSQEYRHQSQMQKPKKSIYRVFGVKSHKILNKQLVQQRPQSSYDQLTSSTNFNTETRQTNQMTTMKSSHTALKPPTSLPKQLKSVNARSTAAKIVLRNLGQYQSAKQIRKHSSESISIMNPTSQKKLLSKENSISFLGQYLNSGNMPQQQDQLKLQSSLMQAKSSKQGHHQQSSSSAQVYMNQDKSTTIDPTQQVSQNFGTKASYIVKDFTIGDSIEPLGHGFSRDISDQVHKTQQSQETIIIRDKLAQIVENNHQPNRGRHTKNTFYASSGLPTKIRMQQNLVQNRSQTNVQGFYTQHSKNPLNGNQVEATINKESVDQLIDETDSIPSQRLERPDSESKIAMNQSYEKMLQHVLEHSSKNEIEEFKSNKQISGQKHHSKHKPSQSADKDTIKSLPDIQQCSALFRDMQGELKELQVDQQNKARQFNVDNSNFISEKEKDRRILKKLIGEKHKSRDYQVVKKQTSTFISTGKVMFVNEQVQQETDRVKAGLEQFANEQMSSIAHSQEESSILGGNTTLKHKQHSSPSKAHGRRQSSINVDQFVEENAHLYADDQEFDLEDMLQDESEDEECQKNFEINQHKSDPISLEASHKYRNAIKDSFYKPNSSPEEKQVLANQVRDADFWLTKGISMTAHNQLSTAIQCYKQSLLLNQNHYVAMHNLAVCYERRDKYSSALKWFKRASKIKPDLHFTYIGVAVNYFKLAKFEIAANFVRAGIVQLERKKIEKFGSLDYIEPVDEEPYYRDTSQSFQALINDYQYVLSLCLRKLRMFEEAGELYLGNSSFYRYPERIDIVNSIFGLLLLPMCKDRRIIADELEVINEKLTVYKQATKPITRPLFGTLYQHKKWSMKHSTTIAEELRTRSFFKRFKTADIVKFLPLMKVKQHEIESVMFPDFDVCIILDGLVESKFHNSGERIPKPLAKYTQGDILGYLDGDNGSTAHVETWSICMSQVEAIWMSRENFHALWQLQNKDTKKMLVQVVRMQRCFSLCNNLTVHMIAFELLKFREFKYGQVIVPINKRSSVNPIHREKLEPQTNAILKSVLKQRETTDKFGLDRRVSNWQIMLKMVANAAFKDMQQRLSMAVKKKVLKQQMTFDVGYKHSHQKSSVGQMIENYEHIHDLKTEQLKPIMSLGQVLQKAKSTAAVQKRLHSDRAGLFIIDTGRCKIIQEKENGHQRLISVIGRNDSFGGASCIKMATLDYLGTVISGGDFNKKSDKPDQAIDEVAAQDQKPVTCWYLTVQDIRRIPEFELKNFRDVMESQNQAFMQIGARKYKIKPSEISQY